MSNERDELANVIEKSYDLSEGMVTFELLAHSVLAAGYRKPRTIGYVVVDAVTKALDWDGELHASREAAIAGLTGPRQMYCKTVDEENDEKTYWARDYMICPVEMPEATA